MNIFYTNHNPVICAQEHCDKHVIKQLLESVQLLSTAHRVLDGTEYVDSSSGRRIKRWKLDDPELDNLLYKVSHCNHPSAVWVRKGHENYEWLHSLLVELCKEYTFRYGKIHKCEYSGLVDALHYLPFNIPVKLFSEPPACMPDKYIVAGDAVASYQNYVRDGKQHIHSWKNRPVPYFIVESDDESIAINTASDYGIHLY